jgi:hypothetical protein
VVGIPRSDNRALWIFVAAKASRVAERNLATGEKADG